MKECVSYFRIESLGTLGSLDIFGPANHTAVKAMIFHVVQSFTAINCMWNEKVSYRCLTMNLYSFVSITRHNFLSINPIVVLKEFWRFFETVRGFYINSAPESNRCLFSSYLQGRTQTTQIGPHISSRVSITCGVPQGSVLGPLLFLLYINDMYLLIS